MRQEIRLSASETRRIDDTTRMIAFLIISPLALLTIIQTSSAYPTNARTIVDFSSKLVADLPPNQREALNAIVVSDKRNGKGSKPVSPQKLNDQL